MASLVLHSSSYQLPRWALPAKEASAAAALRAIRVVPFPSRRLRLRLREEGEP